jgi:hypothetical protein
MRGSLKGDLISCRGTTITTFWLFIELISGTVIAVVGREICAMTCAAMAINQDHWSLGGSQQQHNRRKYIHI